jgi:hypothetical protein
MRAALVGIKHTDQLPQVSLQTLQRRGLQLLQRLRQDPFVRIRSRSKHSLALGGDGEPHSSLVSRVLFRGEQAFGDERANEVAGRRLVHVHRPCQATDTDLRMLFDHAERPDMGARNSGLLLRGPKVLAHGVEDHPKLAQHAYGLRRQLDLTLATSAHVRS